MLCGDEWQLFSVPYPENRPVHAGSVFYGRKKNILQLELQTKGSRKAHVALGGGGVATALKRNVWRN